MFGIRYIIGVLKCGTKTCANFCAKTGKRGYNKVHSGVSKLAYDIKSIFGTPHVKEYQLLEKCRKPIEEFPTDSWAVPKDAKSYTLVRIGKTEDPSYQREIVTFFDRNDKIIRRFQKGSDIPNTSRVYDHDVGLNLQDKIIDIRRVHTEQYLPLGEDVQICAWKPISDEEQYVQTFYDLGKPCKHPKKLHIIRTDYNFEGTKMPFLYFDLNYGGRKITMTEYPITYGVEPKTAKKEMQIGLNLTHENGDYVPSITKMTASSNVQLPKDDEFLPYRFLLRSEKQKALAKYFLKKRGISEAGVYTAVNNNRVEKNAIACFESGTGSIFFKDFDYELANVAAHEVEHAWQHCMIGRVGAGKTEYEKGCLKIYGPIKTPEETAEAMKYVRAREIYPNVSEIENLRENPEYWDNYLEVKAREAGEKAQKAYNKGKEFLLNQFSNIPQKEL